MKRGEGMRNGHGGRGFSLLVIIPVLFLQAACGVTIPLVEINEKYRDVFEERGTEYRLKPGDALRLDLFLPDSQSPEQIEITVRPDGRGDVPFVNDTLLAGRTIPELRTALEEPISRQWQNAEFNIQVVATGEQVILVGQFEQPGTFDLLPRMTLGMAVNAAGGARVSGNTDYVQLIRPYRDSENPEIFRIDLFDESGELLLLPGDQINLERTFLASVVAYWQEYILGFVDVRLVFGRGDFGSSN